MTEFIEATRQDAVSSDDIYDRLPCGLLTSAEDGRILRVNATLASWTGLTVDELVGALVTDLLEPGARVFYETRLLPAVFLHEEIREIGLSLRTANGQTLPVLVNASVDRTYEPPSVHLAVFDASQRQDYERQLLSAQRSAEQAEARTRVLQDAAASFGESETVESLAEALAGSAVDALDAATTAVFLNDHGPRLIGGTSPLDPALLLSGVEEVTSGSASQLIWSAQDPAGDPEISAALHGANLNAVLIAPLSQGSAVIGSLVCFFARDPDLDVHATEVLRSLCRQAAQTFARLQVQARLAAIALYDPLTGLANRVLLREHITASVSAAITNHQPIALIFVDLDDFKAVNDELDHTAGDTVLKLVAGRLVAAVRSEDLVCRYGGDEFIIVCQNTDQGQAAAIGERIRIAIKQPLHSDGWQRSITASVGVTVHTNGPTHLLSGPELLRVADKAMYRSKDRGKDQVSIITYQ